MNARNWHASRNALCQARQEGRIIFLKGLLSACTRAFFQFNRFIQPRTYSDFWLVRVPPPAIRDSHKELPAWFCSMFLLFARSFPSAYYFLANNSSTFSYFSHVLHDSSLYPNVYLRLILKLQFCLLHLSVTHSIN